jgi:hypothetical protein
MKCNWTEERVKEHGVCAHLSHPVLYTKATPSNGYQTLHRTSYQTGFSAHLWNTVRSRSRDFETRPTRAEYQNNLDLAACQTLVLRFVSRHKNSPSGLVSGVCWRPSWLGALPVPAAAFDGAPGTKLFGERAPARARQHCIELPIFGHPERQDEI